MRRNRRYLRKVPTPTRYDTAGDESQIPDINSEPTPKVVQVEDTNVPMPVLTKAIRTRFQNREPQVVDLLGNLFVIERTFSTVDFVDFWTVVIVFHIGQLMPRTLLD